MRKSDVSRENLMSYKFLLPLNDKSPISCLMRKSHVSRENLMSYQFGPPNQKISCLLSHEQISCLKRKSHVFSVLAPPTRKSFVSCLMRKSHVSRENLMSQEKISCFSVLGHPPNEKISCLLSYEIVSCPKRKSHVFQFWVTPPTRKSPVSCLMR